MSWEMAFALTVGLEAVVYTAWLRRCGYPWVEGVVVSVALNVTTHPLVWFAFPRTWAGWGASEVFALMTEAALLAGHGSVRPRPDGAAPSALDAFLLALAANGFTAGIGLLL